MPHMAEDEHDYKVGPGRPLQHTRFKEGQSGNPGGPRKRPAGIPGRCAQRAGLRHDRWGTTKHEAALHDLVNKSTYGRICATKVLFNMMKDAEQKAGVVAPRSFG